jgi:hypothetical protein
MKKYMLRIWEKEESKFALLVSCVIVQKVSGNTVWKKRDKKI